jgi:arsenical pump membrane protein
MGTGFLTAILSSIMNNLPTVLVGALSVDHHARRGARSDDLCERDRQRPRSKITPIGSLATLLWLHVLANKGTRISWGYYFRVGIVLTLPVLFVTLAALAVRI